MKGSMVARTITTKYGFLNKCAVISAKDVIAKVPAMPARIEVRSITV